MRKMLTHPLNFRVVAKTSLELLYLPIYSLNIKVVAKTPPKILYRPIYYLSLLQLLNPYIS